MIIFKKARSPNRTLNDLNAYISSLGDEPVEWLEREVRSWGEFSYSELEAAILDGRLDELIDWQTRYAHVVDEHMKPLWFAAIACAASKATDGKVIFYDSNPNVQAWLFQHGAELVTNLSDESRRAIAAIILRAQATNDFNAREIAKQIRPLIGLTERQALANSRYRDKIYRRYLDAGLNPQKATERANKAATRYASKQHRFRAETIAHTELAFAYNQGADMGIRYAIGEGLMGRCKMVWTTAGTNRVCSRCMALKDTVVGYTDEQGVQLPPLHPRCRCAIDYREVEKPQAKPNKPLTSPRGSGNVGGGSKTLILPVDTGNVSGLDGFVFDLQRFSAYDDQVASHGGSGNIKPDKVIEGHERTPSKTEPQSIIDHKDYRGAIDKRIFYDENGRPYFEINTTNHGNAKNHPYGKHGEHAHDIKWADGKAQRETRELTEQERKDNGDIL